MQHPSLVDAGAAGLELDPGKTPCPLASSPMAQLKRVHGFANMAAGTTG